MIYGLNHATLCCKDPARAETELINAGYEVLFREEAVSVPASKIPLLRNAVATHGMVFLQSKNSIALEIVLYPESSGNAEDLFHVSLRQEGQQQNQLHTFRNLDFRADNSVYWNCKEKDECVDFWSNILEQDPVQSNTDSKILHSFSVRSPIVRWNAAISIGSSEQSPEAMLDDLGISCVSLICKDVRKTESFFLKSGASYSTGLVFLEPGGQKILVALLR